jgi:hypothetical protein
VDLAFRHKERTAFAGEVPAMVNSGQPPVAVVDFADRYHEPLNRAIANRMRQVGVPDEMIGFKYPGVDEGAFVRYPTAQVGGNINPHTFPGRRPAINLDCGVLDVSHPAMSKVPSWSQASLRDRIEAAVAHEYTEALAKPMPGLSFHDQALKFAPETALDISSGARQILREYRTAMGLD